MTSRHGRRTERGAARDDRTTRNRNANWTARITIHLKLMSCGAQVCTKFQRVEVEVEESAIESARHDTNTRTDNVQKHTHKHTHTGGKRTSHSETNWARTHTHTHYIDALVCSLPVNLSHHIANVSVQAVCVCVCVCVCMYLFVSDARHAKLITNFHILSSYGVNKLLW